MSLLPVPVVSRQAEPPGKKEAVALDPADPGLGRELSDVVIHASNRWLKNEEVLLVLERFQDVAGIEWPQQASSKPQGV